MDFQQVTITPEGKPAFNVCFNPNQYSLEKSNQIVEAGVPGLQAPILQFAHGNARTLTMELFFDTYEKQTDVSEYTDKIYGLLQIDTHTHAPPICQVKWGEKFRFRGVLDHASGKFDLFLANGTPVRATVGVMFKEFIDVTVLVQEQPTQSADHRKRRVVKSGERLDTIAAAEYGDPGKWRLIADANGMDDPASLQPGSYLVLPASE
jgi:nucleoid-associated protein YgaU